MKEKKFTEKEIQDYMKLTGLSYESAHAELIKRAKLKELEKKQKK